MLLFDAGLERSVWELRQRLAAAGIAPSDGRPHVTLVVASELDTQAFGDALAPFAVGTPSFPLHFGAVGSFPGDEGVAFLSPAPTEPLLHFHHRALIALLRAGAEPSPWSVPGVWMPHCTLAQGAFQPQAALEVARSAMPESLSGWGHSVALMQFPEATVLWEYALSGAA